MQSYAVTDNKWAIAAATAGACAGAYAGAYAAIISIR